MEIVEKIAEMAFHGVDYIIKISAKEDVLYVDIEQKDNGDTWKNSFTASYIEEITQKTGNFKKFPIFIKMLLSSINKTSESVFLDILTYQDLEMLKARKQKSNSTTPTNPEKVKSNKRYMILTYSVEYDKIHYPLPLNFEEIPDIEALRNTIRRLRLEVEDLKKGHGTNQGNDGFFMTQEIGGNDNRAEVISLKVENEALKEKVKKFEEGLNQSPIKKMGAVEYDQLLKSKSELEDNFDNLKKDYIRDIKRMKAKLEETETQLEKTKEELDKIKSFYSESNEREFTTDQIRGSSEEDQPASIQNSLLIKYQKEMERLSRENENLKITNSKLITRSEHLEMELESALKRNSVNKNNMSPQIRSNNISPTKINVAKKTSVLTKNYSPSYRPFDKRITAANSGNLLNKFSPTSSTKVNSTKNLVASDSKLYGQRLRQRSLDNSSPAQFSAISRGFNQKPSPLKVDQRNSFGANKKSPQQNRYISPANRYSNNSTTNSKVSSGNKMGFRYNNLDMINAQRRDFDNSLRNKQRNLYGHIDLRDRIVQSKNNISLKGPGSEPWMIQGNRSDKIYGNSSPNIQQQLKENIQVFKELQNTSANVDANKFPSETPTGMVEIGDRLNKLQDLINMAKH